MPWRGCGACVCVAHVLWLRTAPAGAMPAGGPCPPPQCNAPRATSSSHHCCRLPFHLCHARRPPDASIWLYQFIQAMRDERGELVRNAHLLGFFRRICRRAAAGRAWEAGVWGGCNLAVQLA